MVLCALVFPAAGLRADAAAELRQDLLAATLRAIGLEIQETERKLQAAQAGTGSEENLRRFRQKLADLERERDRLAGLDPEDYPAPVSDPAEAGSVLDEATGFGTVIPPLIREVVTEAGGPCTAGRCGDGAQLAVEGTSRSGPFYRLAGIAGGDYGLLKPGKRLRLELCLVYRREYFGLIGDYYVYVSRVR